MLSKIDIKIMKKMIDKNKAVHISEPLCLCKIFFPSFPPEFQSKKIKPKKI